MKKIHLTKFVCIVVASLIFLTCVTGCEVAGKKTEISNDKVPEAAAADSNTPMTGLPIVTKPLTLKYWIPLSSLAAQYIRSNNENEVYMELEKRTGIHMDFIHPAQGQETEQFNLMIASGDLPDIISAGSKYMGGEIKGVDDGVFVDLTPYLQKYAPDYYKLVTGDAEVKRETTSPDGRFPAFYMVKPLRDPPSVRILLRKDWLAEIGQEIPKTIHDYENMFKAIKEKKNIAPYLLNNTGIEEQFLAAFGALDGMFLPDGKKVALGNIQPQFKDYLTLMNKWYVEGYIAKDFPSIKGVQIDKMFDSEKVGMYVSAVVAAFNRTQTLKIPLDSAPYPRVKLGDKRHCESLEIFPVDPSGGQTVISKNCKNVTEAIRWLNYGYTKEGALLYNYGNEGKTYIMENGKPKFTDYILNNPKFSTDPANYILKAHFAPKIQEPSMICNPNIAKSPESAAMRTKWADDKDVDSMFRIPPIQYTSEEISKKAQIMSQVNTYCEEMTLKFIIGAQPLSKFDEYVGAVKKLNIDEAVKITQDAYDRYISKK